MTKTYTQIIAQIETLQQQASSLKAKEVDGVIERIKEAIAAYGLTAADLGLAGAKRGPKPAAVKRKIASRPSKPQAKRADAPKYSDGNGNVWSGRGPRPKWLKEALGAGKALSDFAQG